MIVGIGYLASVFLALSLIVTNALKFRIFNILGCVIFIIYGGLISAFPIILANGILLCINVFQLYRLQKSHEEFQYVMVGKKDKIVEAFLAFYKKDIAIYFPDFNINELPNNQLSFVVLRDAAIANLFIAIIDNQGNATVAIDYTIPPYRDYKVGKFIFEKEKSFLIKNNIKKVVYEKVSHQKHLAFIKMMGFTQQHLDNKLCWVKNLI